MPRTIPIALASHVRGDSTTVCLILKVIPVQPGVATFGITTLDTDVMYDDGTGMLRYSAAVGAEPSNLTASADLAIAGGETKQLMPVFDTPVTEEQLSAGACDYAKFIAYAVNYRDLTQGHMIIQTGTLGRNTMTDNGLSWIAELRGLTQKLKQSITEKWSLTCRTVFGSTTPTPQSRHPCNYDVTPLWIYRTVVFVGTDTTQEFLCDLMFPTYGGQPGFVEWLTGANAGRSDETESITQVGSNPAPNVYSKIGLTFGAAYPIASGDTFRFRDDCPKTPAACQARNNYPNYRGEPSIPVSDNGALSVGNIGGSVSTTTDGG